jgi:hypothetical protein
MESSGALRAIHLLGSRAVPALMGSGEKAEPCGNTYPQGSSRSLGEARVNRRMIGSPKDVRPSPHPPQGNPQFDQVGSYLDPDPVSR